MACCNFFDTIVLVWPYACLSLGLCVLCCAVQSVVVLVIGIIDDTVIFFLSLSLAPAMLSLLLPGPSVCVCVLVQPLLKAKIIGQMLSLLTTCPPVNEAYRACAVIAGVWRLLDSCQWRERVANEHSKWFGHSSPTVHRLMPPLAERQLAGEVLEEHSKEMEEAISTFLRRFTPKEASVEVIFADLLPVMFQHWTGQD